MLPFNILSSSAEKLQHLMVLFALVYSQADNLLLRTMNVSSSVRRRGQGNPLGNVRHDFRSSLQH